ncbi:MAG: PD40 domain-containing protein [Deltaproteobacteria bacterium]|jgi:Tol biopolymer transport system component|nr:PD40 domain-containing protein [Deltaproteobacteria bacterium]MBW2532767.1 PD40 domain-containing protein [Deltaproteobacteria bacterium]
MVRSRWWLGGAGLAAACASLGCSGLLGLDEFTGDVDGGVAGSGGTTTGSGTATGSAGGSGGTGGEAAAGGGGGALGDWSVPQVVVELDQDGSDDDDPSFTADGLELYFNSDRDGDPDVFRSTRGDTDQPWGTPLPIQEVNTGAPETNVVVAPNGLSLWFSRLVVSPGDYDIYVTTRSERSDSWNTPEVVPELNTSHGDYPCAVTPDGHRMVLSSNRNGADQLFETTFIQADGVWNDPLVILNLDQAGDNKEAWSSPYGQELYFASNRPGGAGNFDIYLARRATFGADFDPPQPVIGSFHTAGPDSDPWLSPALDYIMFSRGVDGSAPRQIYEAFR